MRQDMAMLLRISVILACCIFGIVSNAASVCSLTNTRSTEYSESRSFSTASLNCARCCGDTVIVESISRFTRNTRDLLDLVEQLTEKQVEFVSRKEAIDTTTPTGKFMLTVFAAVAELEREYILQRQREGIAIAKEQGKYTGRKPMPLPDNFERVVARWRAGEITAAEAMRQTGLKPNTFYRRCPRTSLCAKST